MNPRTRVIERVRGRQIAWNIQVRSRAFFHLDRFAAERAILPGPGHGRPLARIVRTELPARLKYPAAFRALRLLILTNHGRLALAVRTDEGRAIFGERFAVDRR